MGGWIDIGGSSSQGSTSTQATLTPEQTALLKAQTDAFTGTFLPAYQSAISGANNVYGQSAPYLGNAALNGYNQSANIANATVNPSLNAMGNASNTLSNLMNPDFIKQQIAGVEQPILEQNRELQNTQNAQFGAAGGLGSSRQALADSSLSGLNSARLNAAATGALSTMQGQAITAATNLGNLGNMGLNQSNNAANNAIAFANAPTDLYSKYASVLFGVPQQSVNPNFAGTQGSTSQGNSMSTTMQI